MHLQAEGAHDLEDGSELGAFGSGEGPVEVFAGEAGLARDVRHAFGSGDGVQGEHDRLRIAVRLLDHGFEIQGALFRRGEVVGCVIRSRDGFGHDHS